MAESENIVNSGAINKGEKDDYFVPAYFVAYWSLAFREPEFISIASLHPVLNNIPLFCAVITAVKIALTEIFLDEAGIRLPWKYVLSLWTIGTKGE